jgi:hypothetical protein
MGPSRVFLTVIAVLLLYCSPLLADSISVPANWTVACLDAPSQCLLPSTSNLGLGGSYGIAGWGPAVALNGPAGLTFSALTFGLSCCQPGGYGGFRYVIGGPSPGGHTPTSLFFIVAARGGFTSVNQLGNDSVAHVIPPKRNPPGHPTVTVPDGDPSTLTLLLVGLGGSGVAATVRRRRARGMREGLN